MDKQRITLVARLGLSLIFLVLLLMVIDRQALVTAFSNMQFGPYFVGLALYLVSITLWAVRWRFLITASGDNVSLWRVWTTILVGGFFALFLPTVVGNDLARMYRLSPEGGTNSRIVSTVLLDRAVGLISLVLVGLGAGLIGYQYISSSNILPLMVFVLVAFAVGWVIFFNRNIMQRFEWVLRLPVISRLAPKMGTLYEALRHLHDQPRLLLATLGISLLMQATEIVAVVFVARSLGLSTEPVYFFVFMPIIWVITMIPLSASGLGLREGTFAFFFVQVGVTSSDAVAMSLLYYTQRLIVGVLGGLFLLKASLGASLGRLPKRQMKIQMDAGGNKGRDI